MFQPERYRLEMWRGIYPVFIIRDKLGRFVAWKKGLWRYSLAFNFKFKRRVSRRYVKELKRYVYETIMTDKEIIIKDQRVGAFPFEGEYYGALCQIWREERDGETERIAYENLVAFLEDFLGYKQEYWWFVLDSIKEGSGWQPVFYDPELVNKKEMRIENEDGTTIRFEEEYLE